MSNRAQLERYIPMVTFISEICGKNYEVILHDVSDPENSVISIFNGHLSGRKVGDPMTELARNLVRDQIYEMCIRDRYNPPLPWAPCTGPPAS